MNCMVCDTPFSADDTEMIIRDSDTPICDDCAVATVEIHVKYDGENDLLDYLKKVVPTKGVCGSCESRKVDLLSIKFGNPIEGNIQCKDCKLEDVVDIYLEMV
ncbi:hypothetical protein [Sporosarcina pasteurii]|uniref:Uncharacterized protein n=1 Tax=Sporosarcina pasteurii TaxID=1474 RepID=A0A380BDW0_SPOPA|nr:hypothetical protein [Sporosarcina pasteurii]MDS9472207.1 hypothetical protein [Sporosarcina pasteurii]QBQ06193.1 hypothetical protein E2C16_11190 [Sporosarcina pasteurii]SUI99200.1 Uncharacterised protein [Sporosarcina pasteurii]